MGNLATPIAASLKFTDFVVSLVTKDLDVDVARRRARGNEGASIAWVVGHLLHYRYQILNLLGNPMESPYGEQFSDAGASDGSDYPDVAELTKKWFEVSEIVHGVLAGTTDDAIDGPVGGADSPHGEKKVLDSLTFLTWHEAYHMGQLGTLRTQFGLTPTATLAVESPE